jgi:hypothetical protein
MLALPARVLPAREVPALDSTTLPDSEMLPAVPVVLVLAVKSAATSLNNACTRHHALPDGQDLHTHAETCSILRPLPSVK